MDQFKMQLNLVSFLKLSMIVNGCMGVGSIPIMILLDWGSSGPIIVPLAFFIMPLVALFNGVLSGIVGFPIYFWLSRRIGFRFKAKLYPI